MNLINVLVIAISGLTILSALALVFGSSKSERLRSLWFLAAAIGEVMWSVSIAGFLSLGTGDFDYVVAPWLIKGIYVGAIIMDSTILGYVSWKYRFGKVLTTLFLVAGAVLITIFLYDPSVLYSSFTLSGSGNIVHYITPMEGGWFFGAYIVYFCTIVPAFCLATIYRIRKATDRDIKKGYLFFMIGLAVAGFLSLIFDLIGAAERYDLIWVGPLAIGLTMLGFYYAVLRYRMINLATGWLKVLSTIVIVSSAVIVYLLIFHLIFSALFRISSPSFQVILLNFIMIAIVLLLTPAISEIWAMIKSLIMDKQIDIAYIVKKLSKLDRKKMNLKDVSGFLEEHMHFQYVGFLVQGQYYVVDEDELPAEAITKIEKMTMPAKGIWQNLSEIDKETVREYGIYKVAVMTNTNGDVLGQVVFGKPTTKTSLDREDTARTEMIVNLMGTMIENGGRKS
ncbi:hypothetical protein IJJ39_01560 [Candidatus Saccharibacteria bacterium]|nr:hypothetical protein [Candidatus Saccharibacteria bacterium]